MEEKIPAIFHREVITKFDFLPKLKHSTIARHSEFQKFLSNFLREYNSSKNQIPSRRYGKYVTTKEVSAIIKEILEWYWLDTEEEKDSTALGLISESCD